MSNKQLTVAAVLNANLDDLHAALGMGDRNGCMNCLEEIKRVLNNEPRVIPEEKERCINTLTSSLKNPSRFLSTFVTWTTCISMSKTK